MAQITIALTTESHPAEDHHWTFSPECLDQLADQAVGVPVTINFAGDPVGRVVGAERTDTAVDLVVDLNADEDLVRSRVASPAFVAVVDDWNDDYTERVIGEVSLRGVGLTDD